MSDPNDPLIDALRPIWSRVRRDRTAIKTAEGRQAWTDAPLTRSTLAKHLNGGPQRGVCPLVAGGSTVELAVLDFDSHKGEVDWATMSAVVARVVDMLEMAWGMNPILFRSSGGRGVHLYLLWGAPQDAYSVRRWLGEVLVSCGLRNGTRGVRHNEVEVFPKQDSVPADGYGSQFILPMGGKGAPLALQEVEDLW
jgi:hypothetical protein